MYSNNYVCINRVHVYKSVHMRVACKKVYIEHPYDCFTKSIPMTALWCPAFSNHG